MASNSSLPEKSKESSDISERLPPVLLSHKVHTLISSVKEMQLITTYKEVLDGLGKYISKNNLYDPKSQKVCCKGDDLGSVLGTEEFSMSDLNTILPKLAVPISKISSCSAGSAAVLSDNPLKRKLDGGFEYDQRKIPAMQSTSPVIMHIPPSPTYCDLSDSVESIQGYETAYVKDTSDEFLSAENGEEKILAIEETFDIEYEVETDSSNSTLSEDSSDSEEFVDHIEEAIVKFLTHVVYKPKPDSDIEFFADASSDDDELSDAEISEFDFWSCPKCNIKNKPTVRYCFKCFQQRCNWLPDKPSNMKRKHRRSRISFKGTKDKPSEMSALFFLLTMTVLFNSSFQVEVDSNEDEYILEKFRDLFSEFLPKSVDERPSKRVRDTSKANDQSKEKTGTGEINRLKLTSLYSCNYFDSTARLCINVRQLGTTLTIGVLVEGVDAEKHPIHWYRVYKVGGQSEEKSLSFVKLAIGNLPWNINLGGNNNELRISPITETDFSYNFFLATLDESSPENVQAKNKGHLQLMIFRIEPISINMGIVYHGEEITINVRSHMELPAQSIQFEWYKIGSDFEPRQNLPSNMKLSRDGSALIIKEHRNYGDMTLTCAVYSNKNFTLGRRNFFLKKIVPTEIPNITIRSGVRRKRRYLEKFYAHPFWNTERFLKRKRDSNKLDYETQTISYDLDPSLDQTPQVEDLSEISSSLPTSSQFSIIDKPKETILNFYENSPIPNVFATESEVNDQEKQSSNSMNGLIKQANSLMEPGGDKDEQYPTVKIIEEKPSFEDKESMLIADCNVDADCGINAVCFHIERTQKFCKCLPHYRGNGMFCWMF